MCLLMFTCVLRRYVESVDLVLKSELRSCVKVEAPVHNKPKATLNQPTSTDSNFTQLTKVAYQQRREQYI